MTTTAPVPVRVARLSEAHEPSPGSVIEHGPQIGRHVFRRDLAGGWGCACEDRAGWLWPNVVAYVNRTGPATVADPAVAPALDLDIEIPTVELL